MTFRLLVADLDSPSYFVATAAAELGCFAQEGIEIELVRDYGAEKGPALLRAGTVHFLGGPAYIASQEFPDCKGVKLICALSQYSYWFLAVRADLDIERGDMNGLRGLRISASQPWPELGLKYLLADSGIDLVRDNIQIVPPPKSIDPRWKGRAGIEAIEQKIADAYWGNGMRAALGEHEGIAKLHLDLRRGDGPPGARWYNFAALTVTDALIAEHPEIVAAAVRAIVRAQKALQANPGLSTAIAKRLFHPEEVPLIAGLIERDAPFYDAHISPEAIDGLNRFAHGIGLISAPIPYEHLVASQFSRFWA
ncbi:MAG TPA: ABC transporter substrate-binding protein [Xanthobacteraceae bacterium]|nr:ABC transporter substrate-binding protein [Xanthobacteraceae bacterium]